MVRQRTAEIGVRMALGATPVNIFKLVVVNGLLLSAAGIVIGFFATLGLTRIYDEHACECHSNTFGLMVVLFFLLAAVA